MAILTPQAFIKAIDISPSLMVLLGEDLYYRKKLLDIIRKKLFQDLSPEEREEISFERDTNLGQVKEVINTYSFFASKRLILLSDTELLNPKNEGERDRLDKLASILQEIPEFSTVVIIANKLDKRLKFYKSLQAKAAICACEPINTSGLAPWLKEEAKNQGGTLTGEAVATIMAYVEPLNKAPLALLEQELYKLATYCGKRTLWTKEDVEAVFAQLPEVEAFKITDALGNRQLTKVLRLLERDRAKKVDVTMVMGKLNFKIRQLLLVKELGPMATPQSLSKELGIAYRQYEIIKQAQNYTKEELTQAIIDLADFNYRLRLGGPAYPGLIKVLVKLMS